MSERVDKYLARHADLLRRPLAAPTLDFVNRVVVIPVLAEPQLFTATLKSLAANPAEDLERTLVIVVVNNRERSSCATDTLSSTSSRP